MKIVFNKLQTSKETLQVSLDGGATWNSYVVSEIIENVKKNGDSALFEYCEKFDKAVLSDLLVSQAEIDEAVNAVDPKFLEILEKAAENIRNFHQKQVRNSFIINDSEGVVIGQKVIPVDRAGLYVPGGTAAYPSTVLMDAIPAKIAGVFFTGFCALTLEIDKRGVYNGKR